MKKRYRHALTIAFAISLVGCGNNRGGSAEAEASDAADVPSIDISAQQADIIFQDENEFIAKISTDPTLSKKLGTSTGKIVEFKDYNVYSSDQSEWEKGGNLSLLNDYSLGNETKIECQLSASDGDAFLKDTSQRHVAIKGQIQSFSSARGLTISPCIVTP